MLVADTLTSALVTAGALGVACAVLSVFVVAKRWAFIGEGIAHAGFGGAGTAWILAMLFPAAAWLSDPAVIYAVSILFCFAVAISVAFVTRRRRTTVDTVVGIFLVASLAWGFLAYGLYAQKTGHMPPQFGDYLGFERLRGLTPAFVSLAVVVSAGVVAAVALAWKELLFYSTDERQAEASGVNIALVHYGLILLLAAVIVVGMRLMGTVLIVALLVLPGATGQLLGRSTRSVWLTSTAAGVTGALAGVLLSAAVPAVPEGPAIVLVLFALFLAALGANKLLSKA